MEAPNRRFCVTISLDGDTAEDIEDALRQIHFDWARGSRGTVTGGCSSGWIVEVTEDPEMTHDEYITALNRYLEWTREQRKADVKGDIHER